MSTKDRYERLYEAGILNEYGSLFKQGMWEFIESEIATAERDVLEEYTQFLLKHNYCDADVYAEEPTAVERFMKLKPTN